jgi:hypothetical protein
MNLKIRTMLPAIVSALALLLVVSAGLAAYDAMGRRQDAEAFVAVNRTSQFLLQSAGQWAIERGMTNAPLSSPDALAPERRAEIVKMRASADQAFQNALHGLRALPAMNPARRILPKPSRLSAILRRFVPRSTRTLPSLTLSGHLKSSRASRRRSPISF